MCGDLCGKAQQPSSPASSSCAPSCQISAYVWPTWLLSRARFESSGRLRRKLGGVGGNTHHGQAVKQGPLDAVHRHGGARVLHGATQSAQAA